MTAHRADPAKVEAQRKAQSTMARREGRDRRAPVAEQLVRGWDAAQRARIRTDLLRFRWLSGDPEAPEMQIVGLIDRVDAEER